MDLVRDGVTGFLVEPRNVAAYAERIGELVDNPALRRAAGGAGHAVAQGFEWERINETVLHHYLQLAR